MDEWKHELMNFTSNQKKHERGLSCFSHVWIFATLWTIAFQVPLSTGFSRQEYWSELPFPSPGVLPDPGIKLISAVLQADSLPLSHHGLPIPQRLMQIRLSLQYVPSPAPPAPPQRVSCWHTYHSEQEFLSSALSDPSISPLVPSGLQDSPFSWASRIRKTL